MDPCMKIKVYGAETVLAADPSTLHFGQFHFCPQRQPITSGDTKQSHQHLGGRVARWEQRLNTCRGSGPSLQPSIPKL